MMSKVDSPNTPAAQGNWNAVIHSVQTGNQQIENSRRNISAPGAPLSSPAEIPSRRAPNPADGPLLKEGMDNMIKKEVHFAIEYLIAMLFKLALKERSVRRESRMDDAQSAMDNAESAADEKREQGVDQMVGASLSASAQVAGSATVIAGGVRNAKVDDTMTVSNRMMGYQAASQTFGATGQMAQGAMNYEAKQSEAEQTLDEATSTQYKSFEDIESNDAKEEGQLIDSIIQMQQKMADSDHEVMRSIA